MGLNDDRLIAALGLLTLASMDKPDDKRPRGRPSHRENEIRSNGRARSEYDNMVSIIKREAAAQGVPEPVALAMAWVESGMNPHADGDLDWHERTTLFDNVVPHYHPFRWNRKLWHSYGLFQLLAPYHVGPKESPEILYDPEVNAQRGIRYIKKLWNRHKGNLDAIRLAYTGISPSKINEPGSQKVLARWYAALKRYGYEQR